LTCTWRWTATRRSPHDLASATAGNAEAVNLTTPVSGRWYYILLQARQPFSGVTLYATYD
jgi:microbial collagenase